MMNLEKVILDSNYTEQFEILCLREGWISKTKLGHEINYKSNGIRIYNKSKLLRFLTLCDTIDLSASKLDFSELKNVGLINKESKPLIPNRVIDDFFKFENNQHELESILIFLRNGKKVLLNSFIKSQRGKPFKESDIVHLINKEQLKRLKINIFESLYDDWVKSIEKRNLIRFRHGFGGFRRHENLFLQYLRMFLASFIIGLRFSINNQASFLSPVTFNDKRQYTHSVGKLRDNIQYVVRADLKNEMNILPAPQSINDVLRFREKEEIIRFREVLKQWLNSVHEGNQKLELKMRRDIGKANKELKRISKWKEFDKSQFNFWMNAAGGHIPIMSNVLTVINMIGGLYEKTGQKRNDWVLINM